MPPTKNVLSIQSSVAYGHVGNSAATLPLQRLGIGVWPVHTTHLSNHLGHPTWRGGAADTATAPVTMSYDTYSSTLTVTVVVPKASATGAKARLPVASSLV